MTPNNPDMHDDDFDIDYMAPPKARGMYSNIPLACQHEFYLSGELLGPEVYIDWFQTIRHASENDLITIHINCPGGDSSTLVQFLSVLDETKAHVAMSVEGVCLSAATILFLRGDSFSLSEFSQFMFHNYSGGRQGKGGELYDAITHEQKWSSHFLHTAYKDFLTEDEISSILDGKDLWLDAAQVTPRLKNKIAKRQAELDAKGQKATPKRLREKGKTK